jgi:HEAT repeat protein
VAALSDPDARVRVSALRCLQDIGDPRAVAQIAEMLADQDAEVRATAAAVLGSLGDDRAIAPLEELLARESNGLQPSNRQVAITADLALKRIRERIERRMKCES